MPLSTKRIDDMERLKPSKPDLADDSDFESDSDQDLKSLSSSGFTTRRSDSDYYRLLGIRITRQNLLLLFVSLFAGSFIIMMYHSCMHSADLIFDPQNVKAFAGEAGQKVNVTAFVMSICPDAVFCEDTLKEVLPKVEGIVNFQTDYIADSDSTAVYGATCKHGDNECLENIIQLCIRDSYPDRKDWFEFILCSNNYWYLMPSDPLIESCAQQVGIDYEKVKPCVEGQRGKELFLESVKRKDKAHVVKSCTIVMNGRQRCIRDGGMWYSCPGGSSVDEFVASICDLYTPLLGQSKPEACGKLSFD
ncbi:hypothetical protein HDV05_006943 [Chytridiales sp. JEL 0842]|nr:hypothetical protein HDV05_006943 [Chytridiales sp. JEL 0842]